MASTGSADYQSAGSTYSFRYPPWYGERIEWNRAVSAAWRQQIGNALRCGYGLWRFHGPFDESGLSAERPERRSWFSPRPYGRMDVSRAGCRQSENYYRRN